MISRRKTLIRIGQLSTALLLPGCARVGQTGSHVVVNDVQSQLNETVIKRIVSPASTNDIRAALRSARADGGGLSVAGGRHAMGGQQFATHGLLLDMTRFNQVVRFDRAKGLIEVEAGIEWPELIDYLVREQTGSGPVWAIREKQTGVDRVSIGGSLASNVHGRGLRFPPIVGDVESFDLMNAHGDLHRCSRQENRDLFSLAIGGYGLFGVITRVTLRLVRRTKVRRLVDVIPVKELLPSVQKRIEQGCTHGDCQYSIDLDGEPGQHPGVFACYEPVSIDTPIPPEQKELQAGDWGELYQMARVDKRRAFEKYADYYRSTDRQVYWSDTHQLAGNFDGYRRAVDRARGTEMITEVYVAKENFLPLLIQARQDLRDMKADMTYGTIRFIEKDTESFLAWATEPSVCIVCNLHVEHTTEGVRRAARQFRAIIDRAIEHGGRYYLTYHRWATRPQVERCYPQFVEFLKLKRRYDPHELFQSNWYRHHRAMFFDKL